MEPTDHQLLREFSRTGSDTAFASLARRHADLVYAAAIRQVQDPALASDITQAVFLILSRKAGRISPRASLPGWLVQTTRHAAANALRTERRRRLREAEAHQMHPPTSPPTPADTSEPAWENLGVALDEGLAALRPSDRDALVLRYLKSRNLRQVGDELGLGEDAARKRVARALERLRLWLVRQRVSPPASALSLLLSTPTPDPVPAALLARISATPTTQGAQVSAAAHAIALETLTTMSRKALTTTTLLLLGLLLAVTGLIATREPRRSGPAWEFDTDTIRLPGPVSVRVAGVPGTRWTGRMRVGGKESVLRNGTMPLNVEYPGRPFELSIELIDGPGDVHVTVTGAEGILGEPSLNGVRGIHLRASENRLAYAPLPSIADPAASGTGITETQ